MKPIPFFLRYLRYFKLYSLLLQTTCLSTTPIPLPPIMSSSAQTTSQASVTSNLSTRRESLHAHWVACQDAHPSEHRSLMSPSSQSPAPSHFTPLSAITLHRPLLLFSAAGGLSDGPLSPHPASQAGMAGEAEIGRAHV